MYIASYENIRSDLTIRAPYGPGLRSWDIVIAGEAQRIKNSTSGMSMAVKTLKRTRSWALTGTPLENRLDDLLLGLGSADSAS
jgi:SNF2 family DNA or RNA helicase